MHCHMGNRELVGTCQIAEGAQLRAPWPPGQMALGLGAEVVIGRAKREGSICIHIADLHHYTAETNTTL